MMKMMRNLAWFAVGALLAVIIVPAFAAHNTRHATIASTVRLMVDPTIQAVCSAVMIAPERALTAAHCADRMEAPLLISEAVSYPILEAYYNTDRDLAVLVVPGAPCPCATIGD